MHYFYTAFVRFVSVFYKSSRANVATLTGVLSVPIFLAAGAAFDYTKAVQLKSHLQEIADSAALAAAGELGLASADEQSIKETVYAFVQSRDPEIEVDVTVESNTSEVSVNLSKFWEPLLIQYVDKSAYPVRSQSKASRVGVSNICVLALSSGFGSGLEVNKDAAIKAQSCSVHSNTLGKKSILLDKDSTLAAFSICSSGGYFAPQSNVSPEPEVDCNSMADPLSDRQFGSTGICDYGSVQISGKTAVLNPGNYCGPVEILNGASVELRPGYYRFINGGLFADGHSKVTGKYVTLHFSGATSHLHFTNLTTIELSAMKQGASAGILLVADRTVHPSALFQIRSVDAKEFTGLVYLPFHKIEIGADPKLKRPCAEGGVHGKTCKHCLASMGEFSDWTAIVAKQIEIQAGVELVMNSDFRNSDIPLPSALYGSEGVTRLIK